MLDLEYIFNPERPRITEVACGRWLNPVPPESDIHPEDLSGYWRDQYEERAAIREYHGGQAREHAEAEALREIVAMMRKAEKLP